MKVKQQTLKGFECEIEDLEVFKAYYSKNAPLLQGHLLILKGLVNAKVRTFLDEQKAIYIDVNKNALSMRKKRTTAVLEDLESPSQDLGKEIKPETKSVVYDKPMRSGAAITSSDNMVFTSRINSGAVIESTGSIQIFGIIDGLIKSNGTYMILSKIGTGTVIFHEEELDKSQFSGSLKLVEYKNGAIVIKEIE